MTDTSREQLGKQFLFALQQRDWSSMRLISHPEIVWSLPGASRISHRE
jgi:hypothetical protein